MPEKLHSTTKILPLKERVEIASRMAHRVFTHFELWRVTATVESRKRHWDALDDHWDHMRFLEHGQLVTAVVEIHSLLDANEATVNLPATRTRALVQGPDGNLYTANDDGEIWRLVPN